VYQPQEDNLLTRFSLKSEAPPSVEVNCALSLEDIAGLGNDRKTSNATAATARQQRLSTRSSTGADFLPVRAEAEDWCDL
jgi:hypothetical protein